MAGVTRPSDEYVGLTVTLLDSLIGDPNAAETALLQLQALFGPMLVSALQLVDKREVVRVSLPSDRYVYQVSGSTGNPYTLYLDCPDSESGPVALDNTEAGISANKGNTIDSAGHGLNEHVEGVKATSGSDGAPILKRHALRNEVSTMKRSYCPCPGFAYNSLAGEKNVLCKHILAALIAWKTERSVTTEVSLTGVVDLLGLRSDIDNPLHIDAAA